MMNPKARAILVAAALAAPLLPAASAPPEGKPPAARPDPRMASLEASARAAEAKIAGSAEARAALQAATPEQAKAILLRNGFTAQQLAGVPVRVERARAPTPDARIKSITIKVTCCPPEIVITIRF